MADDVPLDPANYSGAEVPVSQGYALETALQGSAQEIPISQGPAREVPLDPANYSGHEVPIVSATEGALDPGSQPTQVAPLDRPSSQRIAEHAGMPLTPEIAPFDKLPDVKSAENVPANLRFEYARSLLNGEVDGAGDFAERAAGAALNAAPPEAGDLDAQGMAQVSNAARSLATALPDHEDLIDWSAGTAAAAGLTPTPASVALVKQNMLQAFTTAGLMPDELHKLANENPLVQEALTTPSEPLVHPSILEEPELTMMGKGSGELNPIYSIAADVLKEYESLHVEGLDEPVSKTSKEAISTALDPHLSDLGFNVAMGFAGSVTPKVGELAGVLPKIDWSSLLGDESGALGKARVAKAPELPSPIPGERPLMTRVEDDINRLRTNDTADKIVLMKAARDLPPEWQDKTFQEQVSQSVEQRLVDPAHTHEPDVQAFLDQVKPLTGRATELAHDIAEKLGPKYEGMVGSLRTVDEGYMHRIVKGDPGEANPIDPNFQRDAITGSRPNNFSRFAPGMQARSTYVLANEVGDRTYGKVPLGDKPFKLGDTVPSADGHTWKVAPATMEEVEAGTKATGNPIEYHKNFLANTMDNLARLQRIDRNVDFMQTIGKELEENGLYVKKGPGDSMHSPVNGLERIEVPGMDGWVHPKIKNALDDFMGVNPSDLDSWFKRANRFLMNSLFISPAVHIANVGTQWTTGRGFDWINPMGYGRLVKYGAQAAKEVWTMGPKYVEALRDGNALQYGSTQTDNFYSTLLHKVFNEQLGDEATWGSYAKSFGFAGVRDLVQAEMKWSKRVLWSASDMFMLQRKLELEAKGLSPRDAIFQAEKDIPNYRVPSQVLNSRPLSEALQSPNFMNFGRYHYGLVRSMSLMVQDMIKGGGADLAEGVAGSGRMDAIGKATMMAVLGLGVFPLISHGIQQLTGNQNASFGPFGALAPIARAIKGFSNPQKNWISLIGSVGSLAPMLDLADKIRSNKDVFGRDIINFKSTPTGVASQLAEAGIGQFYPGQLLLQGLAHGPAKPLGALLGVNLPGDPPTAKKQGQYDKRDAGTAMARERKDAFESWMIDHGIGSPPPGPKKRR